MERKIERGATIFLRLVVIMMGLMVFGLCIAAVPILIKENAEAFIPIMLGVYLTTIPFYFALYQMLKLLGYIDNNKAFSDLSVKALSRIKHSAITISLLYAALMSLIYFRAEKDDDPGVLVIGLIFMFAPIVVATFAAVAQRLLQNAIDIKSENDLTV